MDKFCPCTSHRWCFNVPWLHWLQELFHCHDAIKKRQYDKPAPQLESTPFIHINRDSYKTVGLHKSADEPLVCVCYYNHYNMKEV